MENEKLEKTIKDAKLASIIILIIKILHTLSLFASQYVPTTSKVISLMIVILLLVSIIGYKDKRMYGPIFGCIVSVLFILSADLLSLIVGIGLLVDCIYIIKNLRG